VPEEAIFNDAVRVARQRNQGLGLLVALARGRYDAGELPDCLIKVMFENEKHPLTDDENVSIANSMVSAGIGQSALLTGIYRALTCLFALDYHMSHSQLWALGAVATSPPV
jgi:hypothetical protein